MKLRSSREINVFNISMLDVIFSALGAILILYIMSMQYSKESLGQVKKSNDIISVQEETISKLKENNERQRDQLNEARALIRRFERKNNGGRSNTSGERNKYKIMGNNRELFLVDTKKRGSRWRVRYSCKKHEGWIGYGGDGIPVSAGGHVGD